MTGELKPMPNSHSRFEVAMRIWAGKNMFKKSIKSVGFAVCILLASCRGSVDDKGNSSSGGSLTFRSSSCWLQGNGEKRSAILLINGKSDSGIIFAYIYSDKCSQKDVRSANEFSRLNRFHLIQIYDSDRTLIKALRLNGYESAKDFGYSIDMTNPVNCGARTFRIFATFDIRFENGEEFIDVSKLTKLDKFATNDLHQLPPAEKRC